jgi:hypothetical protein
MEIYNEELRKMEERKEKNMVQLRSIYLSQCFKSIHEIKINACMLTYLLLQKKERPRQAHYHAR